MFLSKAFYSAVMSLRWRAEKTIQQGHLKTERTRSNLFYCTFSKENKVMFQEKNASYLLGLSSQMWRHDVIVRLEIIDWIVEKIGKCRLGGQLYLGQLICKQSADSLMIEMIVNRLQMCSYRPRVFGKSSCGENQTKHTHNNQTNNSDQ